MSTRRARLTIWAIWGLVGALALFEAALWAQGAIEVRPLTIAFIIAGWTIVLSLAALATRVLTSLAAALAAAEEAHRATRHEVAQLQMHNEMLDILARSVDVPLAFQALAQRIAGLVPCDRVGLALLTENDEFQTYTARVNEVERRTRPRPEVVFKAERTAIGTAVRSQQPMILNDTAAVAPDYLDVNVLHTSGFGSGLVMPLVARGRAVGTLNVVSRRKGAFTDVHVRALQPVTEIFAVAHVAQQLQLAVTRHQAVEAMTELTLGVSAEIQSALQTIIGHCDLLERGYPDTTLQRDLATVVRQAQRISGLLDKMRTASNERLLRVAEVVKQGIPK